MKINSLNLPSYLCVLNKLNPYIIVLLFCLLTFGINLHSQEGENSVTFNGKSAPIKCKISASEKIGSVLFESDFSDSPAQKYNIVLIHGEMPDPNIKIELWVKQKFYLFSRYKKYESIILKRFDNGRFWAKFKLDSETQQVFKIAVINSGVRLDHILTIYEVETWTESSLKEDTTEGHQSGVFTGTEHPAVPVPKIRTRQEWNASAPTQDYILHAPKMFTIHHTVGKYPANFHESVEEMQFIQNYHQNARGWIDIGYHFLIDPSGNIFEGRPINVVGAHAQGKNTTNVGIAIMGNYHPPDANEINPKSIESFVNLGKYISERYEIKVSSFYAHRNLNAIACPGDDLYKLMPELKKLIFVQNPIVAEFTLPVVVDLSATVVETPASPQVNLPENIQEMLDNFPDTENLSLKQLIEYQPR